MRLELLKNTVTLQNLDAVVPQGDAGANLADSRGALVNLHSPAAASEHYAEPEPADPAARDFRVSRATPHSSCRALTLVRGIDGDGQQPNCRTAFRCRINSWHKEYLHIPGADNIC